MLHLGHTANTLPCAILGPRQNKVHWQTPRGTACLPCAVTAWHTAKLIFRFIFFCLITNISDSNQINITGNSYILHQMSQSFHISQFASHSIHRSPNANIANHTNPNVVDTSPSSTCSSYMSIQAQVQTIVYTKSRGNHKGCWNCCM